MYNWFLNINNFSDQDRESIARFILEPNNKWTQDKQVKKFEEEFATLVGSRYSVFVSSGSTANTILAQYIKDTSPSKRKIVLPSTTWQTSCSPWIREGFDPVFIDISLTDFCMDTEKLEEYLQENHSDIACVFPTSLIGFTPNISEFIRLAYKYNVRIMFDNCENTLGKFNDKNISSYFTSTTSTYFGHQIQSVEGGFIFTDSQDEYEYFLMLRNHGMTRSLSVYNIDNSQYINSDVDKSFDFYCLGNNYRNTDINAFIGRIDLKRAIEYAEKRKRLYKTFKDNLDSSKFFLPETRSECEDIPFCLPIISNSRLSTTKAKSMCINTGIEYRPIISGFLGLQTCYKKFFRSSEVYKNSSLLHNNGFYVGLHHGLENKDILFLCDQLNSVD